MLKNQLLQEIQETIDRGRSASWEIPDSNHKINLVFENLAPYLCIFIESKIIDSSQEDRDISSCESVSVKELLHSFPITAGYYPFQENVSFANTGFVNVI